MSTARIGIIGAGPVGTGLATDLGLRGIDCVLVDKRDSISNIPKGQYFQQRTMDIFDMWGVADDVRAARLMPEDYPIGEVTCFGSLSSDVFFSAPERETVQQYYFQRNDRMPQYQMEGALRAKASSLDLVDVRLGTEAVEIRELDSRIQVDVVDKTRTRETLEFDYLVGCDGGHSLVRSYLNIDRHGATFSSDRLALVVFKSEQLDEFLLRHLGPKSTYRAIDPRAEGSWKFLGRVAPDATFFYHGPTDASDRDSLRVDELLHEFAGFEFEFSESYRGIWDARVRVADAYRRGRVFLAGDAAHTHPPYGGFGVNNGLEDAANLGWKLAASALGWGGEALLDSYSEERRGVFDELGNKVIASGVGREANFFKEHAPGIDDDRFVEMFADLATEMVRDRTVRYVPHYDGSEVVMNAPGCNTGVIGEYSLAALPGRTLSPQQLSSGRNVFEDLGPWFTLLDFSAGKGDLSGLLEMASKLEIPVHVIADDANEDRAAYQRTFVLVRPDRFVGWSGDSLPDDVEAFWSTMTGRR